MSVVCGLSDDSGGAATSVATRILIVEDDMDSREGMTISLTAAGHEVWAAANAAEAAERAQEVGPDVVILDLGVPGATGLSLLSELRRRVPTARVVVLSAFDEAKYESEALELGAELYMEKPITGGQLAWTVESVWQAASK